MRLEDITNPNQTRAFSPADAAKLRGPGSVRDPQEPSTRYFDRLGIDPSQAGPLDSSTDTSIPSPQTVHSV